MSENPVDRPVGPIVVTRWEGAPSYAPRRRPHDGTSVPGAIRFVRDGRRPLPQRPAHSRVQSGSRPAGRVSSSVAVVERARIFKGRDDAGRGRPGASSERRASPIFWNCRSTSRRRSTDSRPSAPTGARSAPMMRRGARLHRHDARLKLGEELWQRPAPQLAR